MYTLDFSISLGSTKTGLTLNAQLYDSAGANVGGVIAAGFVEIGGGNYHFTNAAMPDSHRGGVKFFEAGSPATILTSGSINPTDAETVAAIAAKTDNLPDDPAGVGDLPAAPDNTGIAAIQTKTDNLPGDPAGVSDLPAAPDNTGIAAIQTKTDNLPGDPAGVSDLPTAPDNTGIAAIQTKTDNLPADPASETTLTAISAAVAAIAPGVSVAAILAANIDTTGTPLTLGKALEVITAILAGKAAFDIATKILTVYGRDDTTVIATYTLTGNGEHSAAVIA